MRGNKRLRVSGRKNLYTSVIASNDTKDLKDRLVTVWKNKLQRFVILVQRLLIWPMSLRDVWTLISAWYAKGRTKAVGFGSRTINCSGSRRLCV